MQSETRPTKLLAIVIAAALVAAAILTAWPVRQVRAIQDSEDFPSPVGLIRGQVARLTIFNYGEAAAVGPEYKFLDRQGNTLAQSADTIIILPGQFRTFDLDVENLPPAIFDHFGRAQMRAEVTVGNPDIKALRVSVEVFDKATGRTSFVIQPPPEPD